MLDWIWPVALLGLTLGAIWLYTKGVQSGERAVERDQARASDAARKAMAEAEAEAPRGKADVVARLRKNGL